MTTPERQTIQEVQALLKAARPEQIERLVRDIMTASRTEDDKRTGRA